ncbi:hypothetical protein LSCM1_07166 [Leishmania martiniquensis]|uniref:Uncharacterized protein n=1 Tax=Leishmania martiniquensis TaxID=1580590 RepID=A0A836HZK4_9TRYP|nr:hypothetical protein LSCM1_07166 [Leishmania martiniquensis]
MRQLRQKKRDLDVWAPPLPLPAAAGASEPASAFQERFANRTEVVGKGGVDAHLGVAAAPASKDAVLLVAKPKRGTLAPLPASKQAPCNELAGAPPPVSALRRQKAQRPVRIRITAPSEKAHPSSSPLPRGSLPVCAATPAMCRGSVPSLPSSTSAARAEGRVPVPCLLSPSAAAAVAATSGAAAASNKALKFDSPLTPLHCDAGLRRCPSTAASSTGTPIASSHMQGIIEAAAASSTSAPLSRTPHGGDLLSVPWPSRLAKSPRNAERPASTTTTTTAAVAPSRVSRHTEQVKVTSLTATRLNQDRHEWSPSASTAAVAKQKKLPSFRPYSLSSYKALMAGISAQKPGGLGPSDTDAQRAAREKRDKARAYAKRAMEVARASLAGAGSRADEADPCTTTVSPVSASARSYSSEAAAATTTTTATASLTSRSTSGESSVHCGRRQRGTHHAAATPRSIPPRHADSRPSRAATPQPHLSAAAVEGAGTTPSCSRAENPNAQSLQAVRPSSSAPPQRTPAVAAFSVAAAPRWQIAQARRRRERALRYAREVSQKCLRLTPAECKGGDAVCAERRGAASRPRQVAKSGAADDADEEETWLDGSVFTPPGAATTADAPGLGRIQQLQRLLELEALHAKRKEAVEAIRRQLRA